MPIEKSEPVKLHITPDFGGSYLWDSEGCSTTLDTYFPESQEAEALEELLYKWCRSYEHFIKQAEVSHEFDWRSFHAEGIEIARQIKSLYGDNIYLVYTKAYEDPLTDDANRLTVIE